MRQESGFTLTELVITLSIIAVIAAFFSLRTPTTTPFSITGASQNLLSDIRYTQVLSMSFNDNFQINFNASNYAILNPDGSPFNHPDTGTSPIALPTGISLSTTLSTIKFNPFGTPLNASDIPLTGVTTITLTSASTTQTILVNPQTGFAQ
jgi:prepilin-type N-terminal cleavage/methylation domain-containing protein